MKLLAILLLPLATSTAYVTSYAAVPPARQLQWLRELTVDLCDDQTPWDGQQVAQAHELTYAWSHVRRPNAHNAKTVEVLVQRLVKEKEAGNDLAHVTTEDYNHVLEGWARAGEGVAGAERCEQILEAMQQQGGVVQPDLSSFKICLMAWKHAGSKESAVRSQRILERMIELSQSGTNERVLPDSDCFDIVLQTWSRSGHEQAPQQTERLVGAMERLYKATGVAMPRTTSFNAVLSAWAKSGRKGSADRASNILAFMHILSRSKTYDVHPDVASYSTVMQALAADSDQAVAAKKADGFVKYIETGYRINAENKLVPDTILFNTAISCWARSNVSGAFRKARSLLDRQSKLHRDYGLDSCRPDVYTYTSVIATCAAEQEDQRRAFDVALQTYQELQRYTDGGANHVSHGAMLKACAKLLPASSSLRRKWVRTIFETCRENGYVGEMVVSRLREAASLDVYRELMQGHSKRKLPSEWSRNVVETNEYRKKSQRKSRNYKRAEV